jgi:hypothetical protein
MAEGGIESLNVSVAAGIFLFEARRQRALAGDRRFVARHFQITLTPGFSLSGAQSLQQHPPNTARSAAFPDPPLWA